MSNDQYIIRPIAHIYTDFSERFGIPRQAGLSGKSIARIIFEPEFRDINAVKGMESFSHLWLIWSFSKTRIDMEKKPVKWSPTVAPPRLGGKQREGVFATRSPYRPNSLGLSSVKLLQIDFTCKEAPVIVVSGADILNGTEIFDIKPYLPYTDCHPEASNGFALTERAVLQVQIAPELLNLVEESKQAALLEILQQDPRGAYEKQPEYSYGLHFANYDIRFTVSEDVLKVFDIQLHDGNPFQKVK